MRRYPPCPGVMIRARNFCTLGAFPRRSHGKEIWKIYLLLDKSVHSHSALRHVEWFWREVCSPTAAGTRRTNDFNSVYSIHYHIIPNRNLEPRHARPSWIFDSKACEKNATSALSPDDDVDDWIIYEICHFGYHFAYRTLCVRAQDHTARSKTYP